ncbi:hypothetical protein BC827DRAFT_711231 [Russula dissimulans]|nr:hypothetical protein BC827DRAFT_711231 [Russula dissimulans]
MMSIFNLVPFIIIAISVSALAVGNPGYYYYPSYYPPHSSPQQDSPPDRNDHSGGAQVDVLELHQPTRVIPTEARPPYAPPAYGPPAADTPPIYNPPAVPVIAAQPLHVRPDQAYNFVPKTPTYKAPVNNEAHKLPAETPAYQPPAENEPPVENQVHKPVAETSAYTPPAETTVYNPTSAAMASTLRHSPTLRPKKPIQSSFRKVPHMRRQPSKVGPQKATSSEGVAP